MTASNGRMYRWPGGWSIDRSTNGGRRDRDMDVNGKMSVIVANTDVRSRGFREVVLFRVTVLRIANHVSRMLLPCFEWSLLRQHGGFRLGLGPFTETKNLST